MRSTRDESFGRRAATFALALTLGSGLVACSSSRKSLFVLLPDEGRPSQVTVVNSAGSQVLDRPLQSVEVRSERIAPSAPQAMTPQELERIFGEALASLPAPAAHFALYFKTDSTELTPESGSALPNLLEAVRERVGPQLSIVGHTDTVGAAERNYRLGLQRAQTVADLLASLGVDPLAVDVLSHGEADPLLSTGDDVTEPRNRRVEVTVR